jgi:hypothetical protein
MWFKWICGDIGKNGDRAGQLGESEEYHMGRSGRNLLSIRSSKGGSRRLCRLRPASVGPCWTSTWLCVSAYEIYGVPKLSSTVCYWDGSFPTIPHGCLEGIVHGPPTDCSPRHSCEKRALRWGGPWSHHEILPLVVPSWPACVVLLGLHPCKVDYWFKSPRHPRKWVMAWSLCSNVEMFKVHIMLYDNIMNVDDYLVVKVNHNHYTCFGYFCMLILRCKHSHVNQLKMANNMLQNT